MTIIYAIFLCTGLHGTDPCYFSSVVPTQELCMATENRSTDHNLRCAYREVKPAWTAVD